MSVCIYECDSYFEEGSRCSSVERGAKSNLETQYLSTATNED